MNLNPADAVVDEIREVRHRISARFDHDPARLVRYYLEMQEGVRDRLLRPDQEAREEARKEALGRD